MTPNPAPHGWPLLLVMVGIVTAMTGTTAAFLTHESHWRYLLAAGCFLQFLGWILHTRRGKGGTR
ncbi:hypothetical protein [Streptomyces sp. NPDC004682]